VEGILRIVASFRPVKIQGMKRYLVNVGLQVLVLITSRSQIPKSGTEHPAEWGIYNHYTSNVPPNITTGNVNVSSSGSSPDCGRVDCRHFRFNLQLPDFVETPQTVGIEKYNIEGNSVSLFPNPSSGLVNIDYKFKGYKDKSQMVIAIYNALGKQCYTKQLDAVEDRLRIEMSSFENGMYFYRFTKAGEVLVDGKFVINK
jgi:hypothetical protein